MSGSQWVAELARLVEMGTGPAGEGRGAQQQRKRESALHAAQTGFVGFAGSPASRSLRWNRNTCPTPDWLPAGTGSKDAPTGPPDWRKP